MNSNRLYIIPAVVALTVIAFPSCDKSVDDRDRSRLPDNRHKVTISEGMWGDVVFSEGNLMPTTDGNPNGGSIKPVSWTLCIYELTSRDQVSDTNYYGTFFYSIQTRLIDSIRSDDDGFFQMAVPPGRYSVFAKMDTLFWANSFDGQGHIYPVTVETDSVTQILFDINYKAYY